jgi:hypothetical protein
MQNIDIHKWQREFLHENGMNESAPTRNLDRMLNKWFEEFDLRPDEEIETVEYLKQWAENRLEILQNRYDR